MSSSRCWTGKRRHQPILAEANSDSLVNNRNTSKIFFAFRVEAIKKDGSLCGWSKLEALLTSKFSTTYNFTSASPSYTLPISSTSHPSSNNSSRCLAKAVDAADLLLLALLLDLLLLHAILCHNNEALPPQLKFLPPRKNHRQPKGLVLVFLVRWPLQLRKILISCNDENSH